MLQLSTSAGRDQWLMALVAACEAASARTTPVTADMLDIADRYLRVGTRANALGSRHIH